VAGASQGKRLKDVPSRCPGSSPLFRSVTVTREIWRPAIFAEFPNRSFLFLAADWRRMPFALVIEVICQTRSKTSSFQWLGEIVCGLVSRFLSSWALSRLPRVKSVILPCCQQDQNFFASLLRVRRRIYRHGSGNQMIFVFVVDVQVADALAIDCTVSTERLLVACADLRKQR